MDLDALKAQAPECADGCRYAIEVEEPEATCQTCALLQPEVRERYGVA